MFAKNMGGGGCQFTCSILVPLIEPAFQVFLYSFISFFFRIGHIFSSIPQTAPDARDLKTIRSVARCYMNIQGALWSEEQY